MLTLRLLVHVLLVALHVDHTHVVSQIIQAVVSHEFDGGHIVRLEYFDCLQALVIKSALNLLTALELLVWLLYTWLVLNDAGAFLVNLAALVVLKVDVDLGNPILLFNVLLDRVLVVPYTLLQVLNGVVDWLDHASEQTLHPALVNHGPFLEAVS